MCKDRGPKMADCVNSSPPLILRKFQGLGGIWANSGKFGIFRENSGEFNGIQYGTYYEFSGSFWRISGQRRIFGKVWGLGWFRVSKRFCANSHLKTNPKSRNTRITGTFLTSLHKISASFPVLRSRNAAEVVQKTCSDDFFFGGGDLGGIFVL